MNETERDLWEAEERVSKSMQGAAGALISLLMVLFLLIIVRNII